MINLYFLTKGFAYPEKNVVTFSPLSLVFIVKLNLSQINKSKLEEYRERINNKYPDIINVIDNTVNTLTNMLDKIKKDRDDYIRKLIWINKTY